MVVAIPTVPTYNAFSWRNRMWLARLVSFTHVL
jgi:biopolymer transport protein ExbB/TolQ